MMYLFFLLFFWLVICVFMALYDVTGHSGFAVVAMLPLSFIVFIVQFIAYVEDNWFYDERE